jgi:hypothetical protein
MADTREVKALRSDAHPWSGLTGEFRQAGTDPAAAMRHARRAVALVRRDRDERAGSGIRTFAPGDDIPGDVTWVYDVDGDVWARHGNRWEMRDFHPAEHEAAALSPHATPALLDKYGPLTEIPDVWPDGWQGPR